MGSPIGQQIHGIFDRRHGTTDQRSSSTCWAILDDRQHALRRVGGHSIIHEHPDHTAYSETGSQPLAGGGGSGGGSPSAPWAAVMECLSPPGPRRMYATPTAARAPAIGPTT